MSRAEGDAIAIEELELSACIGVPDTERSRPQRLTVSLMMWPVGSFGELHDDLAKTVNYAAVAREVKQLASARTDKLIETLADAIASRVLHTFALTRVRVELRKFVLPDARFVAAICERVR